jgi:hypothetical protein
MALKFTLPLMRENSLTVGQNMTIFIRINIQFNSAGTYRIFIQADCCFRLSEQIVFILFRHESDVVQEQDPASVEHFGAC